MRKVPRRYTFVFHYIYRYRLWWICMGRHEREMPSWMSDFGIILWLVPFVLIQRISNTINHLELSSFNLQSVSFTVACEVLLPSYYYITASWVWLRPFASHEPLAFPQSTISRNFAGQVVRFSRTFLSSLLLGLQADQHADFQAQVIPSTCIDQENNVQRLKLTWLN